MSPGARRGIAAVLWVVAVALVLVAIVPFVFIVDWVRHPGGIGMEWIAIPVAGSIGLVALGLGLLLARWARRLGRR